MNILSMLILSDFLLQSLKKEINLCLWGFVCASQRYSVSGSSGQDIVNRWGLGRGSSYISANCSPWQMAAAAWTESKTVQEEPMQNVVFITLMTFSESGFSWYQSITILLMHLFWSYRNLNTLCNESLTISLNSTQCLYAGIQCMLINLNIHAFKKVIADYVLKCCFSKCAFQICIW